MEIAEVYEGAMKIVVRLADAVALAKRFEESPGLAVVEVVEHVRAAVTETLEQVMKTEIDIFLGREAEIANKRIMPPVPTATPPALSMLPPNLQASHNS